jgi:hypothetical protein
MFVVDTSKKQALLFRQLQIDLLDIKIAKFDTNTGSNFTLFT